MVIDNLNKLVKISALEGKLYLNYLNQPIISFSTNLAEETQVQKPHFRILLVTAMFLLTFMSVSTAFAAPPGFSTFHNDGSFTIDCGTFTINEDYFQDGRVTDFFDNAGNPIRELVQVDQNRILTNLATGFTVQAPGHFSFTIDLQTGVIQQVGLVDRITIPGRGVVVLDTGRLIVDADGNVTFVGPHSHFTSGDDALCAALS